LLRKAGRDNGSYKDRKYVRLAGHAAWSGVLVAVDRYLESKNVKKGKTRKSKEWYTEQLSKQNRKLNLAFLNAYEGLHLHLGYDGALSVRAAKAQLEDAQDVIALCEKG
jgi:hypothetical protein